VINLTFFYYICCFSILPSNLSILKVAWQCNQFRIRRLDTWRHRTCDHSTHYRPLPTPIGVFEILASKCIGVTTFWPFKVSWRHRSRDQSIPMGPFRIGAPLYQVAISSHFRDNGHQTYWDHDLDLSRSRDVVVTWPLDWRWVISYWWSLGPKSLSLTVSEISRPKHHVLIDAMLNRHCACGYMTW